jgi:hypothetical protein
MAKRKFCSSGCKECYDEDKKDGIIYHPMVLSRKQVKGIKFIPSPLYSSKEHLYMSFSWEDGCKMLNQCCYCRESLEQKG